MPLAETRETKREEDMVHLLLAVVDIHIPLIYSEGRHKALTRLQKEISGNISIGLPFAGAAIFDSLIVLFLLS